MNITESYSNFTVLNYEIDNSDFVNLTNDYRYVEGDENVVINKSMIIDGNNHSIQVNSTIFTFESGNTILLKNINFLVFDEFIFNSTSNITYYDCSFQLNNDAYEIGTTYTYSYRGSIPDIVVKMAKEIVGDSKDLEAAKKLAKWVCSNIQHETQAGFYQNTSETLERKLGNCCSHTELFLQMCEVIGITKNHKVCFVHVGTIEFGNRHFFALIDNLCVDVDGRSSQPWGYGMINNRPVYSIIEYPYLPLQREYN